MSQKLVVNTFFTVIKYLVNNFKQKYLLISISDSYISNMQFKFIKTHKHYTRHIKILYFMSNPCTIQYN